MLEMKSGRPRKLCPIRGLFPAGHPGGIHRENPPPSPPPGFGQKGASFAVFRAFPRRWLSLRFLSSSSLVSSCPGFSGR